MSDRIIIKDTPIDIPTAGESPNWGPAITKALQVIADAVNNTSNSVTDLGDENIRSNAQIKATKIEDGSVSSADFKHIAGIGAKNAANGFAGLDSNGKLLSSQLPIISGYTASDIANVPSGTLSATNVQAALNELQTDVNSRATTSMLNLHIGETSAVHGIISQVVGTTDSQTITNKTVQDSGIKNPSILEVKQATKAELTTYALTTTNGQICYATDTKEYLAIKDNLLINLTGQESIIDHFSSPFFVSNGWGSVKTGVAAINPSVITNNGVLEYSSTSTDGTLFTAKKDCEVTIHVTAQVYVDALANYPGISITKNATKLLNGDIDGEICFAGAPIISGATSTTIYTTSVSVKLVAGDIIRFQRKSIYTQAITDFSIVAKAYNEISTTVIPKVEIFATQIANATAATNGILYFRVPRKLKVTSATLTLFQKGSATTGSLALDIKKNSSPSDTGMTSILSSFWTIPMASAYDYIEVPASINSSITINEGNWLRLDLTSVPSNLGKFYISVYGE